MSESEKKLAFATKLYQFVKRFSFLMKLRVCFYFFDSLILFLLRRPEKNFSQKKRICILLLPGMGDCIIFCRLAKSLKKALPSDQYELTILSNDTHQKLLAQFFDNVIGLPFYKMSFNPFARFQILVRLRNLYFDELWDVNGCGECTPNIFISHAVNAKEKRVAYPGLLDYGKRKQHCPEWLKKRIFTELIDIPDKIHLLTVFQYFFENLTKEKIEIYNISFSKRKPCGIPEQYYVFVPSGSQVRNLWDTKKFIALAEHLFSEKKIPIILCGASGDHQTCAEIEEKLMKDKITVINLAGKTSFEELVWLFSYAKEVFTIDTGSFHLAVATGIKTTVIASDSVFSLYINYPESVIGAKLTIHHTDPDCRNCGNNCYQKTLESYPCLKKITVDEVLKENFTLRG